MTDLSDVTGEQRALLPLVYSFRRCPYAMRARMALVLSGHRVRIRELILRDKPEAMLEASPKGTVPVLVLPTGDVIDESLAVMIWAIDEGSGPLQRPSDDERALIERNDGPFKHDLDRYKYPNRYEGVDPIAHRASGGEFIQALNERIIHHGQLAGEHSGFADYAIFPFIRQFRIADQEWFDAQDWSGVHGWLQGHLASDVFLQIMQKYPLWNDTQDECLLEPLAA